MESSKTPFFSTSRNVYAINRRYFGLDSFLSKLMLIRPSFLRIQHHSGRILSIDQFIKSTSKRQHDTAYNPK